MPNFLQDMRRAFDSGQADAARAAGSGRLSMNNAVRISLSAYWPAALAALIGGLALWRLLHWSPWTALGGGLAFGGAVLLVVTRWINRRLDRAPIRDPGAVADDVRLG
jgi:hypothetical protein